MKEKKVKSLLKQIEGPKLEHKSKEYLKSSTKEIAKDISSFINKDGGKILIGIKNNEPDGFIFNQKDEEKIMQICKDLMDPPQSINLDICTLKTGTVIILDILPSREPIKANGKYFYIRHGSTTRHMTQDEIKRKFKEAEKIFKSINAKDTDKILSEKQSYRDIILDKNGNEKTYIEFTPVEMERKPKQRTCIIYSQIHQFFDENCFLISTTLYGITIAELGKILAQYYRIFGNYSLSTSAFCIEQSGLSWVGFGPCNFIKTLKDQKKRYKNITEKYGKDVYIHHRESAFYIDEINYGMFFIQCQPNNIKKHNRLTIDYFDVGFVLTGPPFSRLFNEFFENIDIEPFTITSNINKSIFTEEPVLKEYLSFEAIGLIQSKIFKDFEDKRISISGAYGKAPKQLSGLKLNEEIIVNIGNHHFLKDKVTYYIKGLKYTNFDFKSFPSAIADIDVDWEWDERSLLQ